MATATDVRVSRLGMSVEDVDGRTVLASVTENINAPANEIWPFLSTIGAERILIPRWTRSAVLEGYGQGAVRRVYFGEDYFDDRVLVCDHTIFKLQYEVLEPSSSPATEVLAAVQLHPSGSEETIVTWVSGAMMVEQQHKIALSNRLWRFFKARSHL